MIFMMHRNLQQAMTFVTLASCQTSFFTQQLVDLRTFVVGAAGVDVVIRSPQNSKAKLKTQQKTSDNDDDTARTDDATESSVYVRDETSSAYVCCTHIAASSTQ